MNRLIAFLLSFLLASPAFAINYTTGGGTGGVSQIVAGSGTSVSPVGGTGVVTITATGSGGGSVTNVSAGNLSPLFTTSTANQTTTPVVSFALSNAGAHTFLGNNTGSSTTPSYLQPAFTDLSGQATYAQLPTLTNGHFIVGNGSGVPTDVAASGDVTLANTGAFTIKSSVALSGSPTAPTATPNTNTTQIATTAYVDAADALKANLASPTFTGTPTVPTATAGTNTTQAASTAFVTAAVAAGGGGGGTSGGIVPTTTDLRVPWAFRSKGGSSTFTTYGTGATAIQGTATSADDTNGTWINYLSPPSDFGGIYYSSAGVRFDALPRVWSRIQVVDTTSLRFVFGMAKYINAIYSNDTAADAAAFRYNPAIDTGGTIRFYTTNTSGTATTIDTGVSYTGTHTFCVDCSNPSSYKAYIDGTLVATSTTNLPDPTAATYWVALAFATTTTQKNIKIGSIYGDSR